MLVVAWLFVPATFLLPLVDSTTAPYLDLTEPVAAAANAVSLSASSSFAPVLTVLLILLVVSRKGMSKRRRGAEAAGLVVVAAAFAGGGVALNENVLKEALAVPRPNIIALAGVDGAGPLGMTPQEFYRSGDKRVRSGLLGSVLSQRPAPIPLDPAISRHWVDETGYSLPSGHSFAAFFIATLFLSVGAAHADSRRLAMFYLLLPWAILVCYSRTILRVHTPVDITVGSLQGIALGVLAWFGFRAIMRRFGSEHPAAP